MSISKFIKKRMIKGPHGKILLTVFLLIIAAGQASAGTDAYPFNQGSARFSLLVGSNTAFDKDYTVFGVGGGYYIADGLELGLEAETWQGNSPRINRITPGVTYVMYSVETIKPYGGIFYRRTYIAKYRDTSDAGVRAGGMIPMGRRAYFGVGAVYESHLNCDRAVYSSCSEAYPEIMIAVMF